MSNDFETLHDALLGLRMDWEAVEKGYRQAVTSHLRRCLAPGGLSLGALAGQAADLNRFYSALEQLRACTDGLDEVLVAADEVRVMRYNWHDAHTQSSAPEGDGVPSTSTRAPGAAGPHTRPESGQRKYGDKHQ